MTQALNLKRCRVSLNTVLRSHWEVQRAWRCPPLGCCHICPLYRRRRTPAAVSWDATLQWRSETRTESPRASHLQQEHTTTISQTENTIQALMSSSECVCSPVSTSAMSMKWSSEADASIFPSWLKLSVRTGQSSLRDSEILCEDYYKNKTNVLVSTNYNQWTFIFEELKVTRK